LLCHRNAVIYVGLFHFRPTFEVIGERELDSEITAAIDSEMAAFVKMFPQVFVDHLVEQTNLYASLSNENFNPVTTSEMLTFIGILYLTGYVRLPARDMYWERSADTHQSFVSDAMRRDRFREIFRYIHLADNMRMDNDKYYKVRPIFRILNEAFKSCAAYADFSVDESIIPYFGKHGTKQFIRGKPIRFGFKLWCLTSKDGYLVHAEPYCGSHTDLPTTGMGQGSDVVLGLIEKSQVLNQGCTVTFDNLFTSLPLLDKLTEMGIGGTGTIRDNRLQKAPVSSKKETERKCRGAFESVNDGSNLLVRWNDNKAVTVATNYLPCAPTKLVRRFSKKERKTIEVPMPLPLQVYNEKMGGVDIFDQFVATYRIRMRSKKWWWPFLSWGLTAAMVNAWLLYRRVRDRKLSLLTFHRQIVQHLISTNGSLPKVPGRPSTVQGSAATAQRVSGFGDHNLIHGSSRYCRCKQCGRRTTFKCSLCKVPLHVECQTLYHSQR